MLWRKKNRDEVFTMENAPSVGNPQYNPRIQLFIADMQQRFPGAHAGYDFIQHSMTVVVPAGGYALRLVLPAGFPVTPPEVYVVNANPELVPGLEAMSRAGLVDGESGKFLYHKVYGFSNDMVGSTFVFLSVVALTAAAITAAAILPAEAADTGMPTASVATSAAVESPSENSAPASFMGDGLPVQAEPALSQAGGG